NMTLTTGFTLKGSQVVGIGVAFSGVTAADITIKDTVIAANLFDGVQVVDSGVTDLAIQNSHLGEVRDDVGNLVFVGNGRWGFLSFASTLTGVAFLDSFFNGNRSVG